jgi:hypothetical protein
LEDFNALYDEHSSELICHVSVIHSVNQGLISKEKELNRILTKEEEKSEKTKTNIIDQRKKIINCVTEIEQKTLLDLENNFKTCQMILQEGDRCRYILMNRTSNVIHPWKHCLA